MIFNSTFTKLQGFFKKPSIELAYLFGSQANGKVGPLSDYDFGVLLDKRLAKEDYFDIKVELITELIGLLKTNQVDVVILNEATPNLAMSVIRGKMLYEKEPETRVGFEVKVMKEYLDRAYYEKRFTAYLKQYIVSNYGRTKTAVS